MVTKLKNNFGGDWKMIVKKIAMVSLTAVMAVSTANISALAAGETITVHNTKDEL